MRIKKRILSAVTAAVIAVSSVPAVLSLPAYAGEIYLGDTTITIDDTVMTDSTGIYSNCMEISGDSAVITGYNGSDTVVNIPSTLDGHPVTGISGSAFGNNSTIKRIVIPPGVEFIDRYVFVDCTNLDSVSLPDTLWFIGEGAFSFTALRSVSIPDSVSIIDGNAFLNCTSLTSVKLPEGITYLPDGCFKGCTALRSVKLPSSVNGIGSSAFYDCTSLSSVVFPETMTMEMEYAQIWTNQVANCTSLVSVTLPDSMEYIPSGMFANSGLKSIHIGDGVQAIESNAFYCCIFNELYLV